ncbi:conserved exported hypothetical protein [Rhodospirillaceae bacterium LM-1]|nr:conserved exported hypothetical protein [Rhodospirillaceae bacterium LM-1]
MRLKMGLFFLSITPSAFGKHAFPIEVAWTSLNDNNVESHLIKPPEPWLHPPWFWSETARERHGISRERLCAEGIPISEICNRMNATFRGHTILSDYPGRDRKLLDLLFLSSGMQQGFELSDALANTARHLENLGLCAADFWKCFALVAEFYPSRDRASDDVVWWREFWRTLNRFD